MVCAKFDAVARQPALQSAADHAVAPVRADSEREDAAGVGMLEMSPEVQHWPRISPPSEPREDTSSRVSPFLSLLPCTVSTAVWLAVTENQIAAETFELIFEFVCMHACMPMCMDERMHGGV